MDKQWNLFHGFHLVLCRGLLVAGRQVAAEQARSLMQQGKQIEIWERGTHTKQVVLKQFDTFIYTCSFWSLNLSSRISPDSVSLLVNTVIYCIKLLFFFHTALCWLGCCTVPLALIAKSAVTWVESPPSSPHKYCGPASSFNLLLLPPLKPQFVFLPLFRTSQPINKTLRPQLCSTRWYHSGPRCTLRMISLHHDCTAARQRVAVSGHTRTHNPNNT